MRKVFFLVTIVLSMAISTWEARLFFLSSNTNFLVGIFVSRVFTTIECDTLGTFSAISTRVQLFKHGFSFQALSLSFLAVHLRILWDLFAWNFLVTVYIEVFGWASFFIFKIVVLNAVDVLRHFINPGELPRQKVKVAENISWCISILQLPFTAVTDQFESGVSTIVLEAFAPIQMFL